MIAFVRTLDQSCSRCAASGCYQLQGNLTLCPSESQQKPSEDKRTELKLLPPWGVLLQWQPRRTCFSSTSKESSQPQTINRRLLGPADFQPPENNVVQPFRSQSGVKLKLRQQPCNQAQTLTGPLMHSRPCRVWKRGWKSSNTTDLNIYVLDIIFEIQFSHVLILNHWWWHSRVTEAPQGGCAH